MNPDLGIFINRVIVPALLERFLREQALERPDNSTVVGVPAPVATA